MFLVLIIAVVSLVRGSGSRLYSFEQDGGDNGNSVVVDKSVALKLRISNMAESRGPTHIDWVLLWLHHREPHLRRQEMPEIHPYYHFACATHLSLALLSDTPLPRASQPPERRLEMAV